MTDEEIVVREPDIGLDARASSRERIVQRYLAQIIVVRMARDWDDISAEVGGIVCLCFRRRSRGSPRGNDSLNVVTSNLSSWMYIEEYSKSSQSAVGVSHCVH